MKLTASKTPLLIAAMATAVTLSTFGPANANAYWVSADTEVAEVVPANFKLKVKKHKAFKHHSYKHHGFKHHAPKKKKHVSKHDLKKKLLLKKLF
ncbi:hypothetical protein [uncultured Tateyamaria sp.]|uniref:hypothetical protein n=1 Tax=uncultured Tateyamaria sp. TaxID=455651 RepID=UPI0026294F84|nr:hypothetical protein [uncultured Tateyamaria sp.]